MTRRTPRAAAMLAAGLLLAGCSGGTDAVDPAAGSGLRFIAGDRSTGVIPVAERPAGPELSGTRLDGQPYDPAYLRGNVGVVNFWGSWCAPCRAEADNLVRVAAATEAAGVRFLGVNHKDQRAAALAFERRQSVTYPSLDDQAGRVALRFRAFPPSAIPSTVVLDRSGRVAAVFLGPVDEGVLQPVVESIAKEPA